MLKSKNMAREF